MELFPNTKHPIIKTLSKRQENRVWEFLSSEMFMRNSEFYDKMMVGTNEIPTGSVYSIGFCIIESFKTNSPQANDEKLIDMISGQILLLCKYDEE